MSEMNSIDLILNLNNTTQTEISNRLKLLFEAKAAYTRKDAIRLYNSGYHAGHHDTVEATYTDILDCDMDSYHSETVLEILKELETSDE